jgi:hypothetical protein
MPLDKRFCFHFALKDVRLNSSSKDLAQFYTHRHHNSGLGPMVSISGKLEHQDLPLIVLAISHGACPVGRVEDGRGSLGHSATLRFPSPLIEPDVPISGIRLSDWLHREVHGEQTNRTRLRYGE